MAKAEYGIVEVKRVKSSMVPVVLKWLDVGVLIGLSEAKIADSGVETPLFSE